jgi:hypothetical protein
MRLFRNAVVWLMMLALPLQGYAAASMVNCAAGHAEHAVAPRAAQSGPQPGHYHEAATPNAGHPHAAVGTHDHASHAHAGHHEAAADPAIEADVAQPPVLSADDQFADAKCSACAACCSGAAIVSSLAVPVVFAARTAPVLAALGLPVSFITDGPSRPPRSRLA